MSSLNQNFGYIIKILDIKSDEIFKSSFIYKWFTVLKNKYTSFSSEKFIDTLKLLLLLAICLLFASLSFPQFSDDRFGIGIIIIICLVLFAFILLKAKTFYVNFNFEDLLIFLFLLIATISTFSSFFLKESLIGLSKYVLFISFYYLIKSVLLNVSNKTFINLWLFLITCAAITASVGIYQYFADIPQLATWEDPESETHTRVYSTLGNPNLLAGYLLSFIPVTAAIAFTRNKFSLNKILLITFIPIMIICLVLTGSRGGYIAMSTGLISLYLLLIVFLLKTKSNHKFVLAISSSIGFILILFLIFMFPMVKDRLVTIFQNWNYSSNAYRFHVWSSCLEMLKDNLFLGIGPGNKTFGLIYSLYMKSSYDALAAYNIFLEIAIETGIFGLFIFIFILLTSFLKLHNIFWINSNYQKRSFSAAIFISLIMLISHGLVDTVFFRPQVFLPFWFLLASIAKLEQMEG